MAETSQDIWSHWLLQRRFGGDANRMQSVLEYLCPVRDRVLSHAALEPGQTLLDVGCGDGLIAFGALDKVRGASVIFADISQDLLERCRSIAEELGVVDRCRFLRAPADDLPAVDDESVDAVTTRSVLIYVTEKQKSFDEFYRVLKPGGRMSIFEPINRFAFPEPRHIFDGYDVTPVVDLAEKVKDLYNQLQPVDTDPMLHFDERDLISFAEKSGFGEIHLDLQVEVKPPDENTTWESFLRVAGNPKIPSLEEAVQQTLTPAEAERFLGHLRPLVETRRGVHRSAVAYLWAVK